MIGQGVRASLQAILDTSRSLGFLGPGPVEEHIDRSLAFVVAWASVKETPPRQLVDLGSGGGVPGLVLAAAWPETSVLLLDGSARRVQFLQETVAALDQGDRVECLAQRAEDAGRTERRGRYDLVVARSFGPPSVTAECGAAFLSRGGVLAVAEPPGGDPDRWPVEPLADLGLERALLITEPASIQLLELRGTFPDRYPRRVGVPNKRPLWS